ncbi:transaldolase [Streptomyces sp. NPDC051173]|uniref:transaldolase n=1 Tax=Streptomyces sp. NPDC051173 TaxID=3155164 RepID=UPI0034502939
MTGHELRRLASSGVSVRLTGLDRTRRAGGGLAALVRDQHVTGATSDPAALAASLADSGAYDDLLRALAARGVTADAAVRTLTAEDARSACDALAPVHRETDGADGHVSVALDARLARDAEATVQQARALVREVGRPNATVEIPATDEGLGAVTACLAEGIGVNVTLLFSPERYDQAREAHLAGLEQALAAGRALGPIASAAAFPLGRIDAAVDTLLDRAGVGASEAKALRGTAALAVARLAHERFTAHLTTPRWQHLAAHGARPQRLLWASDTVPEPGPRATRRITELAVPGTAHTMPEATMRAVAAHGAVVPRTWTRHSYDASRKKLAYLKSFGIGFADVASALEEEGLKKSHASWHSLLDAVSPALDEGRS